MYEFIMYDARSLQKQILTASQQHEDVFRTWIRSFRSLSNNVHEEMSAVVQCKILDNYWSRVTICLRSVIPLQLQHSYLSHTYQCLRNYYQLQNLVLIPAYFYKSVFILTLHTLSKISSTLHQVELLKLKIIRSKIWNDSAAQILKSICKKKLFLTFICEFPPRWQCVVGIC